MSPRSTRKRRRPISRRAPAKALAYGHRHRMLLRPMYEDEEGVLPEFAVAAEGYELSAADGRTFIDWAGGWGPVLLGYRHPEVEEAIIGQLERGPALSLDPSGRGRAGRGPDRDGSVRRDGAFGKNGSDVTTAAVRVARAVDWP